MFIILEKEYLMNCACVACFDKELENSIKNIWQQFENNNIGETPGRFAEDPHISMFVTKDQNTKPIIDKIRKFEDKKIRVILLPYGVFNGTKKVIFLNVIVTNELINFRNRIFDAIENCNAVIDDWYKNDRALLHCTIAVDIEDKDIHKAIEIMSTLDPAYGGFINRIQIIEFFPIQRSLEIIMND
jgi:hypothetical protein